jgi:hypothetical protein
MLASLSSVRGADEQTRDDRRLMRPRCDHVAPSFLRTGPRVLIFVQGGARAAGLTVSGVRCAPPGDLGAHGARVFTRSSVNRLAVTLRYADESRRMRLWCRPERPERHTRNSEQEDALAQRDHDANRSEQGPENHDKRSTYEMGICSRNDGCCLRPQRATPRGKPNVAGARRRDFG